MNQELENAIRKVRKLLQVGDKAKNNSEAEAVSAMEMASKLMEEYNLNADDVKVVEMKAEGAKEEQTDIVTYCVPWERTLASAVAKLFGAKTYRKYMGKLYTMAFVGVGGDAQLCTAAYTTLYQTLQQMGKESPYRGTNQRTYLLGVANRLYDRAKDLNRATSKKQEEVGVCKDLVLVKDTIIRQYESTLGLRPLKRGYIGGSYSASQAGYNDGGSVGLPGRNQLT